jgi:Domain of unknown function (DUF4157)
LSATGTSAKTKTIGKAASPAPAVHTPVAQQASGPVVMPKLSPAIQTVKAKQNQSAKVQTKIETGKPGDANEREADIMADRVMRMNASEMAAVRAREMQSKKQELRRSAEKKEQPGSFMLNKKVQAKEEDKLKKKGEEPLKKKTEEKIQKSAEKVQPKIATPVVSLKQEEKLKKKVEEKIQKKTEEKIQKQAEKLQPKIATPVVSLKQEEKLKKKEDEKVQKKAEEKIQKQPEQQVQKMVATKAIASEEEKLKKKEEQPQAAEKKLQKQEEKVQKLSERMFPVQSSPVGGLTKEEERWKVAKLSEKQYPVPSSPVAGMTAEEHRWKILKEEETQLQGELSPTFEAKLRRNLTGGFEMPGSLRDFMEQRFGVDFGRVRFHTDEAAAELTAEAGAQAFAYGNHVFFKPGKYQPETEEGKWLIAHELTHVIQQGHAHSEQEEQTVQTKAEEKMQSKPEGVSASSQKVQGSWLGDRINNWLRNIPGWTLLTVLIGFNPVTSSSVARSAVNLFQGFLELIPLVGRPIFDKLQESGLLTRAGAWLDSVTGQLGISMASIRDTFSRCWNEMGVTEGISGNIAIIHRHFDPVVNRIVNFARQVINRVVQFLRETLFVPLNNFLLPIPGWNLFTVIIGRNPLTGAAVPRTAMNFVSGFADFIPEGKERLKQIVDSRALQRVYAWYQKETTDRNLTWARISATFTQAWDSLDASSILHPVDTFKSLSGIFKPLLKDLIGFAEAALLKVLEFIFEAAMGAGGARVMAIFRRIRSTFSLIISNPVAFLRNLVTAVGQGIRQFGRNILTHLRNGVIEWLTGGLTRSGIQMPQQWNLQGFLFFVLQILGITYANVRAKLVTAFGDRPIQILEQGIQFITDAREQGVGVAARTQLANIFGEQNVARVQQLFTFIADVRERGLMVALRERVMELFGNIRDMVLARIREFIQQRIVMAAIQQLIAMLSPVGAVVDAIIKTYNTVMFFIERINQILAFVESIVNSISNIAMGSLGQAANYIEQSMARFIPVLLGFLGRFLGLGDIAGPIQRVIRGIQQAVDRGIDRIIEWMRGMVQRIVDAGRRVGNRVVSAGVSQDPQERLNQAHSAALAVVNRFAGRRVGAVVLNPLLRIVKARYNLTDIVISPARSGKWNVKVMINPFKEGEADALAIGRNTDAQIDPDRQDILQNVTIVASAGRSGTFKFRNPLNDNAYIANVPLYARHAKTPINIATQYRTQAFNQEDDADKRFALVVGVNMFRDVRGNNDAIVRQRVNISGWTDSKFPIGVFGFTWNLPWGINGRRVADIRSYYNNPNTGSSETDEQERTTILAREQELITQIAANRRYPYGVFRDTILQSNYTQSFIATMNRSARNVQLHTGDPDVVNMRTSGVQNNISELIRPGAAQFAEGLFNRYDSFFNRLRQSGGPPPLVTTGGYRFAFTIQHTEENNLATIAASVLDMNIRRAMQRINPNSVYFPEPNTLFNVTQQNAQTVLSGTFGVGANEGRTFMNSLIRRNGVVNTEFANVPLETGMDERFLINTTQGVNVNATVNGSYYSFIPPNLAAIRAVLNQNQSHANRRQWINNVGNSYGLRLQSDSSTWFVAFGIIRDACLSQIIQLLNPAANPNPQIRQIFTQAGTIRRSNVLSNEQIAAILIQELVAINTNNPLLNLNQVIQGINEDINNMARSRQIAIQVIDLGKATATEIKSFLIRGLTAIR